MTLEERAEKKISPQLAYYYRNRERMNRERQERRKKDPLYNEKMKRYRLFGTCRIEK